MKSLSSGQRGRALETLWAVMHGAHSRQEHPGIQQLPGLSLPIPLPGVKLSCLPGLRVSFGSSGIQGPYEMPYLPKLPCPVPVALMNYRLLPQSIPEPLLNLLPHFKTSSIFLNFLKQTLASTVLLQSLPSTPEASALP